MYLLNEMLMMIPVVVYVGLRLRSLRSGRTGKNVFTLAYILLLPAFPIAEGLAHGAAAGRVRALIGILSDTLPYLLYLILIVVLSDLVIGLLRLLNILSKPTLLRSGFRTTRFWGLLIVPVLIVAAGILNFAHLSISRYRIEVPRRAATVAGLRIVFASDFHLGSITSPRFLPQFVEAVNALAPDLILIGGDVLEGDRPGEGAEAFAAQFRRLRASTGTMESRAIMKDSEERTATPSSPGPGSPCSGTRSKKSTGSSTWPAATTRAAPVRARPGGKRSPRSWPRRRATCP